MQNYRIDNYTDQRPGLLGVEGPPSSPGVVGPPGAEEDADGEGPEGELQDDELGGVEVFEGAGGCGC